MSQAGIAPASGNFQAHGLVVGGVATGTLGQFVAIPVSGNYGAGNVNYTMNDNEWSRFYLSSSFHGTSGSLIQALNFLKYGETSPSAISGNVKINIFTAKILSNNNIETSGAFVAGTTMSGAGLVSANALTTEEATISVAGAVSGAGGGTFNALTTEEATISVAGAMSGAGLVSANALTTEEATINVAGAYSGSGGVQGQSLKIANIFNVNTAGVVSSSGGGTWLGNLFANDVNVSGTLTAANFTPSAVSGAVKINVFTHKILSNNSIETSASMVAKTTVSGAGAGSFASLTTEEATISVAGAMSGAGLVSANALTTEEATIDIEGAYSGSGGIAGQSLTVANLFKVTSLGNVSSSAAAHFVGAITGLSLATSGSIKSLGEIKASGGESSISASVGSGVHLSNTGSAAGTGFKAALFISSSDIINSSDAAKIPRMVMQGTDETGVLKDFMLTVSGGLLQAIELTKGTWPV